MRFAELYPIIMVFIMIVILLGVGLLVLNEFMTSSSVTGTTAETAINDSINALAEFPTWFGIIVVIISAAIILGIVRRSFGNEGGGGL